MARGRYLINFTALLLVSLLLGFLWRFMSPKPDPEHKSQQEEAMDEVMGFMKETMDAQSRDAYAKKPEDLKAVQQFNPGYVDLVEVVNDSPSGSSQPPASGSKNIIVRDAPPPVSHQPDVSERASAQSESIEDEGQTRDTAGTPSSISPIYHQPFEFDKVMTGDTTPYTVSVPAGWSWIEGKADTAFLTPEGLEVVINVSSSLEDNQVYAVREAKRIAAKHQDFGLTGKKTISISSQTWARYDFTSQQSDERIILLTHSGLKGGYTILITGNTAAMKADSSQLAIFLKRFQLPPDNFRL